MGAPSPRRALDPDSPALRLYQKAKRLGIWDPADIDFSEDAAHWQEFTDDERDLLLRTTCLFVAGEESVVADLVPLMHAMSREGRLEDELFLSAWVFEEGKHAEFFHRFLAEVTGNPPDLAAFTTVSARRLLFDELPASMGALLADPSPAAQARALVTYCLVVEGVLADSGHRVFSTALQETGLLPGLQTGLRLLKRDESRHVAYGIYVLTRLVRSDPGVWPAITRRIDELRPLLAGTGAEFLPPYDDIGFEIGRPMTHALDALQTRLAQVEHARIEDTLSQLDLELV